MIGASRPERVSLTPSGRLPMYANLTLCRSASVQRPDGGSQRREPQTRAPRKRTLSGRLPAYLSAQAMAATRTRIFSTCGALLRLLRSPLARSLLCGLPRRLGVPPLLELCVACLEDVKVVEQRFGEVENLGSVLAANLGAVFVGALIARVASRVRPLVEPVVNDPGVTHGLQGVEEVASGVTLLNADALHDSSGMIADAV